MTFKTVALTATIALVSCGGGGGSAPSPLPAVPQAATQSALKVGVIGDSISHGALEVPEPGNPPYPTFLPGVVQNLGINNEWTRAMITDEVPQLDPTSNVVIIEAGTNDAFNALANADMTALDALAAAVQQKTPKAVLVFITLRNPAAFNLSPAIYASSYGTTPDVLAAAAQRWNAHERALVSSLGARMLDMETDPQWYVMSEWSGPDDIHPLAAGAQRMATALTPLL